MGHRKDYKRRVLRPMDMYALTVVRCMPCSELGGARAFDRGVMISRLNTVHALVDGCLPPGSVLQDADDVLWMAYPVIVEYERKGAVEEIHLFEVEWDGDFLLKEGGRRKKPNKYVEGLTDVEVWLPIPGFEEYEVSNRGRIKRVAGGRGAVPGRILSDWTKPDGYVYVNLNKDNKRYARRVHRLVASAFVGPCPEGKEVNHKNGKKDDNRPENLEYVTHAENVQHAYDMLSRDPATFGERHPGSKLTRNEALKILRLVKKRGETQASVARQFEVSPSTVWRIVHGETWGHLQGAV